MRNKLESQVDKTVTLENGKLSVQHLKNISIVYYFKK